MKKISFLKKMFLLPSVAIVALTSCDDKTIDETTSFALSSAELTTIGTETHIARSSPAAGEIIKIKVDMAGKVTWKVQAKTGSAIFTLTPTGEQNQAGEIMIQVKPNTTFGTRTGKVVISDSYTKTDREITFTQAAQGTPALNITPGKVVSDIVAMGANCNFSITTNPATPLTFTILGDAATWITAVNPATPGSTNTWKIAENPSIKPRSGEIEISYDEGKKVLDTLYFNQLGSASVFTPQPVVVSANVHAFNAEITWPVNPDVLTMRISLNGATPVIVPAADGKLFVRDLIGSTTYTVTAVGTYRDGEENKDLDTKSVEFTTKAGTDIYSFKDGQVAKNVSFWRLHLLSKPGLARPGDVDIQRNYTYDTLAMIQDLMLSFQFAKDAGLVDLIQLPNLKNLQIGRGYYDGGVEHVTRKMLDEVITKAHFSKLTNVGLWISEGDGSLAPLPEASQQLFKDFAAANSWFTFDHDMQQQLMFPKETKPIVKPEPLPDPTTESSTVADFADLGLKDRSLWKFVSWTTQEPTGEGASGRVDQMLDGDLSTYYHSLWSVEGNSTIPPLPHEIVIDMGTPTTFNKIVMTNRQVGNRESRVEIYEVLFSNDVPSAYPSDDDKLTLISFLEPSGMTWSKPIEIVNDPTISSPSGAIYTSTFTLPSQQTARCIKIRITRVQATNFAANWGEFGVK